MSAIVIATKNAKCLPVLAASITMYLPEFFVVYLSGSGMVFPKHRTINLENTADNFGDAYNQVALQAFEDGHEDILVCNDDVVLTPYTWPVMVEDLKIIPEKNRCWVAARSDYARDAQNIRFRHKGDKGGLKHFSENQIIKVDVIAPIFAHITKNAWINFPPLNWFSDDIQCLDMQAGGGKHYISRAYVHHVGSQTCGPDFRKCVEDAKPWIQQNRPELAELWFKSN